MAGRWWPVAALITVVACGTAASDHEILGDRLYATRDYHGALVEYRLSLRQRAPNPRLRAKAAAAAFHAEDFLAAADEYRALAREDRDRIPEAAEGLARVAQSAAEQRDRVAFTAALDALQKTAPGRVTGAIARQVALFLEDEAPSADLLAALPYAAAAAPDARRQDSLVYVYAAGLAQRGRCEPAVAPFEGAARRQREPAVVAGARRGAAACALELGRKALDAGETDRAEDWFRRALQHADRDDYARAASLGIGDVLVARGDYVGAALLFQDVISRGQAGDSLSQRASDRLNRIGRAGTPDGQAG